MDYQLKWTLIIVAVGVALFLAMLLSLELGRRFGKHQLAKHGDDARAGVGVADATVYSLLGLLLGFTFSGSATRFLEREQLIGKQVNIIGTTWQRVDLLPPTSQPAVRDGMRKYVDALIVTYKTHNRSPEMKQRRVEMGQLEDRLWKTAVAACLDPAGEKARILLLQSLNDMFGAVEEERFARIIHPPRIIMIMLAVAGLAAALFTGYAMATSKTRNWVYLLGVAATVSITAYVIIELERPSIGLIRVDPVAQEIVEIRQRMN